jgi:hypothetical protein
MNYVYSLSIRTRDDHALCLFGVISFCCYFLLFGFKLIYLFVIMNQLASTTIFIILVDDELDDYFQRFFFRKMDKIYSNVDFADVILSDTGSFYQCWIPMMSTLPTLASSP